MSLQDTRKSTTEDPYTLVCECLNIKRVVTWYVKSHRSRCHERYVIRFTIFIWRNRVKCYTKDIYPMLEWRQIHIFSPLQSYGRFTGTVYLQVDNVGGLTWHL